MSKDYKTPKNLLYPLQHYSNEYETGFCSDGRQVAMGLLCPNLVAYFFDPQGFLLGKETHLWEYPAPIFGEGFYDTFDNAFVVVMEQQIIAFQERIGFRLGTIRVRSFFDEQECIGIELLPEHFRDIETNEYIDDDEKQEFLAERDAWLERGDFVWWWGKDYYINAEGEVDST